MREWPFALAWYDPVLAGNGPIGEMTALLAPAWRRSIRRIGGYFIGTHTISAKDVGRDWLDELFMRGLLREIRETSGGEETWRGAIAKFEYNRGGDVFVRDVSEMANAIRSIYMSIGDNQLTNGSGESGAWTAYNGATVTQDATWVTHGTVSIKIVVADTTVRGATVQSGITIAADTPYLLRASLKTTSGSWTIEIVRDDNNAQLAYYSTAGQLDEQVIEILLSDSNTYAGSVTVRVKSESVAGTINVDAMVFQRGPMQAQTGWYTDANSIKEFGRKEEVLLRSGKSNADAIAECQSLLLDYAWANPRPPDSGQTWLYHAEPDTLTVSYMGYWGMLNWLYTTLHGTKTCAQWVTALLGLQSQYLTAGIIAANSTPCYVEDGDPLRLGDLLRQVTEAGESGGALYGIGVYDGRKLNYEKILPELKYQRTNGRLLTTSNEEIDLCRARPGWAFWQDMPVGPRHISSASQHDPRWVFLEEIELLPPDEQNPNGALGFSLA